MNHININQLKKKKIYLKLKLILIKYKQGLKIKYSLKEYYHESRDFYHLIKIEKFNKKSSR